MNPFDLTTEAGVVEYMGGQKASPSGMPAALK